MKRDFENLFDTENLDDRELVELVYQQFGENPDIDPELVDVHAENGLVHLEGRVGTEQELQAMEQVLTDVLRVREFRNDVVIDELVRGERSQFADDAAAEELEADPQSGSGALRNEESADHLVGNSNAELYGTHDMQEAIEEGFTYEPPDRPVQEGTWSREQH